MVLVEYPPWVRTSIAEIEIDANTIGASHARCSISGCEMSSLHGQRIQQSDSRRNRVRCMPPSKREYQRHRQPVQLALNCHCGVSESGDTQYALQNAIIGSTALYNTASSQYNMLQSASMRSAKQSITIVREPSDSGRRPHRNLPG